jgi:hypothetical protein
MMTKTKVEEPNVDLFSITVYGVKTLIDEGTRVGTLAQALRSQIMREVESLDVLSARDDFFQCRKEIIALLFQYPTRFMMPGSSGGSSSSGERGSTMRVEGGRGGRWERAVNELLERVAEDLYHAQYVGTVLDTPWLEQHDDTRVHYRRLARVALATTHAYLLSGGENVIGLADALRSS